MRIRRRKLLFPLFIIAVYLIFGVLWIAFSDQVILTIARNRVELTEFQTYKGWIFVAVSSFLLFLLLKRYATRLERTLEQKSLVEEQLRLAIRSADLGLFDSDLVNQTTYYSPEWKRQIGYRDYEVGDSFEEWRSRVHPDDLPQALDEIDRCLADPERNFRSEFRLRHKDGTWRWILGTAFVRTDETGRPIRVVGLNHDITDLKSAQDELARSEARFRAMVEYMPVGIFLLDPDGKLTYCNRAAEDLTGLPVRDLLDLQWVKVIEPAGRPAVMRRWQETVTEQKPNSIETPIIRPDGTTRWCRILTAPTIVAGHLTGHVGMIHDLTDLHRTAESLMDSENRYRELAELSPVGIFHLAASGAIRYANRQLHDILSIPPENMSNRTWVEAIHPDDRPCVLEAWDEAVTAAGPYSQNYRLLRLDGKTVPIYVTARPRLGEDGQSSGYVGTVVDLTELHAAREEIDRLNRDLERRVEERTQELERKNLELERINRLFIGRELRMAELKKKLATVEAEKGDR